LDASIASSLKRGSVHARCEKCLFWNTDGFPRQAEGSDQSAIDVFRAPVRIRRALIDLNRGRRTCMRDVCEEVYPREMRRAAHGGPGRSLRVTAPRLFRQDI